MKEFAGFVASAVLAAAIVAATVALQPGQEGSSAADPGSANAVAATSAPSASVAPSPPAARPYRIVLLRPNQGSLPRRGPGNTAELLNGASAIVVEPGVSVGQVTRMMHFILGDSVTLDIIDLRDQ